MDTARTAGARGGIIIPCRWSGSEDANAFYGIALQAEKEMIMIMAEKERRKLIMETVNKKHGMNTEAEAIILLNGKLESGQTAISFQAISQN